jgi:hypothetical protein
MLVVFLLGVVSLHALITGLLPAALLIPALGASILVFVLLLVGYLKTSNLAAG